MSFPEHGLRSQALYRDFLPWDLMRTLESGSEMYYTHLTDEGAEAL